MLVCTGDSLLANQHSLGQPDFLHSIKMKPQSDSEFVNQTPEFTSSPLKISCLYSVRPTLS